MKLRDLVETYIGYKRSLGMRFHSDANTLRAFCRAIGEVAVDDVRPQAALEFIAGTGPVTAHWRQKFVILRSFCKCRQISAVICRGPLAKRWLRPGHGRGTTPQAMPEVVSLG